MNNNSGNNKITILTTIIIDQMVNYLGRDLHKMDRAAVAAVRVPTTITLNNINNGNSNNKITILITMIIDRMVNNLGRDLYKTDGAAAVTFTQARSAERRRP